jgi:hemerythrin superfamily protein
MKGKSMNKKASQKRKLPRKASHSKAKHKVSAKPKIDTADIIQMIMVDHKPLKKLIKVMKDSDQSLSARQKAFEEFAPLLVAHAKPEEQVLYVYMRKDEDLREESFEGEVEHGLADQMLEEAKRTDDEDLWSAKVKVLAELVEHHI